MKSTTFLALLLSASTTVSYATDLDVGGVKLGMKASDLRSSIAKVNSAFVTKELKRSDGTIAGLQGRQDLGSGWGATTPDHLVALYDERGYTWFVGRAQKYEKGNRPTFEAISTALREKYGEPSFSSLGHLEWQFTRSGALYKGNQQQGPCTPGPDAFELISSTMTSPPIRVPKKFAEKCGTHIVAFAMRESDGMAADLVVSVYDAARMYDIAKNKKNSVKEEENKALNTEKAKAVKPKL